MTLPGVGTRQLKPFLKNVLFEPDTDRLSVTWSGRLEVLFPYSNIDVEAIDHGCQW